ncbi:prolipoprotein diacylglyceryl transferase [Glaciihabitans sp. UYNi722]|uniref:prolipoprotein diacylglyceryl transferase n=1 Tax=Glaciihabitans sp. UYNi722 TaxID=3156344 RepID=UPI003393DEE0
MVLPLSIPSPSDAWANFNLGQWLRDIGLTGFPFDINIRTYAVCILVGIVVATILTARRLKNRGADGGVVLDIALWAVPLGIIGARAFHVLTHPDDYFGPGKDLLKVLYVWEGGIAIFGSLIGGAIGAYIGCKLAGVRFWSFADTLAPGLLLAQAFGRFGNYFNHELFGVPTNLPWGLKIASSNPAFPAGLPSDTLFLPTFLYEIIWDVVGVAVILFLERRFKLQWGKVFAVYLIWYGLGRSYFESVRIDPSLIFLGVRTNVWAAWAAIVIGLIIFIVQTRRHPGLEPSVYLPGREWSPTAEVDSDDTYSDIDDDGNDAELVTTTMSGSKKAEKSVTSGAGPQS